MIHFLMQLILGIWLGLLIGISFIETPLKFKTPGITQKVALSVGHLVFGALNKVEIIFSVLVLIIAAINFNVYKTSLKLMLAVLVLIIAIQTIALFPILNERIELIQNDKIPKESNVHLIYVAFKVVKTIILLIAS